MDLAGCLYKLIIPSAYDRLHYRLQRANSSPVLKQLISIISPFPLGKIKWKDSFKHFKYIL